MKIAVRMDDISPGMDWEKFRRFYGMLKDKGIRPLLGVVPANRDENLQIQNTVSEETFWETMKELKEAVKDCVNAENDIKSGRQEEKYAVELLIVKYSMDRERNI